MKIKKQAVSKKADILELSSQGNLALAARSNTNLSEHGEKNSAVKFTDFKKLTDRDSRTLELGEVVNKLKADNASQVASARTNRLINDLMHGLLAGRIEHELRPSVQLILEELSTLLSGRELELLKNGILQTRSHPLGKNIQGVITLLLRKCLEDLEVLAKHPIKESITAADAQNIFAVDEANYQAQILGSLRDLALDLATFLDRPESDGVSDLQELLIDCQSRFVDRSRAMKLSAAQKHLATRFLLQVATAVFFDKLELVLHDYLASGTDYNLVSGKVWASRYHRADYIPFFYDTVASLKKLRPWLFEDDNTISSIASIQVRTKAAALRTDVHLKTIAEANRKTLEGVLLELRTFFGIGLNSLMRNQGQLALRFFERVLTCTADAIEHPQQKSITLSHRLSRVRVQAFLCSIQAEIMDSAGRMSRLNGKDQSKVAKNIFEKKSDYIRSALNKTRYELELLGLSGLVIDINGTSHTKLEGLGEWVSQIVAKEEAFSLFQLCISLRMHREAHSHLCSYLSLLLGFKAWEGPQFEDLSGQLRVELKSGAESKSFWRTKPLACHSSKLVEEVCHRVEKLEPGHREHLISIIPLLISQCFEFEDFDLGFGLAVAHRHLYRQLLDHTSSAPDFELLYGMIDAEIRFRFGLYRGESKVPQQLALSVLALNRKREAQGFFRAIDRKREIRLSKAANSFSNTQALRDLNDFQENQMLREGIHGQFISQEIRMLNAVTRVTKKKNLAKELSSLVLSRIEQRLKVTQKQIEEFQNSIGQNEFATEFNRSESYLQMLSVESRALAAVQVLLDASLSCALLQDEKSSRLLLQEARDRYSQIFPGLSNLIDAILAAQSVEEFRRRVENAINVLGEEAVGGELSIMGTASGAGLGFLLAADNISNLPHLFERFSIASSIARRRVVPGRCKPLERYVIAHLWGRLQHRVISSVVSLNDGLTVSPTV